MSTDAPSRPTMTPEHKAKMKLGRDAAAKAKLDADARLAEQDARLDAVNARLDKLMELLIASPRASGPPRAAAQAVGAETAAVSLVPALATGPVAAAKEVECAYVYMAREGPQRTRVNRRINDPEDERWEGELMLHPFNGDPRGALEVALVTRVDGEIVQSKDIAGGPIPLNGARGFMRQFVAAKAAGAAKPWDLERYFRDKREEEARLKREGKVEELLAMRELLATALKGVLDAKAVA